ncbi:MAG: MarR family transcriptional regulator [Alphaproteobacteria bacterium]|nr:MarR family transcriptional regulator [Alphaproteobacteria bacterium]
MEHPSQNLGFLLHDVARLMRKRFEQNARELRLTRSQCQVLAHLARHEGIPQSGLAEILEVEPITLTRILDRLEAGGLVERRPHATDRRIRQLYLTAEARPLLADIFAIGADTRGEALDGVPEIERDLLFQTLTTMKANLLRKLNASSEKDVERKAGHG